MKNFLFCILWVSLFCMACESNEKNTSTVKEQSFCVSVKAHGFPDSTKVVLYNRDIDTNIDSTYVINEQFSFNGKVALPALSYLYFFDTTGKSIDPYAYFYLENDSITIEGDYTNFTEAKITGSAQTRLAQQYDSVAAATPKKERKKKIFEFLFANANNQAMITELTYIKKYMPKDSIKLFCKQLDSVNANSTKAKELWTYANAVDVKVGDRFVDIKGKDLAGNTHSLSDYEGKVMLLDFWGSGCVPCRKQNKQEFKRLIQKFSANDFVIVSFSLDKDYTPWEQASKEDGISWVNISDLEGLKGTAATKYAVTAIPNTFLIGKDGNIVKSFVGFAEGNSVIENEIQALLQ